MIKTTTESVEEKEAIHVDIEFHEMRDLKQFLFEITAAAAKIRQMVTDLMPEGLRQKALEMLAMILTGHMDGQEMIDDLSRWAKEREDDETQEGEAHD